MMLCLGPSIEGGNKDARSTQGKDTSSTSREFFYIET